MRIPGIPRARYDIPVKLSRLGAPLAVLMVLAVVPVLAGCAVNPVESIIKQATGADVDLGGASLPKDFPVDVPIVDGEIQFGAGIRTDEARVWNVTVKAADPAIFETIKSQLTGAGFAWDENLGGGTESGSVGTFTNEKYTVAVVVTTDGGVTVNYTVTTAKA